MKIKVGPGSLVQIGTSFSLVYSRKEGRLKAWPVNNTDLLQIFPEKLMFKSQILDKNVLGIFPHNGDIGIISLFPGGKVSVNISHGKNQEITMPDTIWATHGKTNFVKIAGISREELEKGLTMQSPVYSITNGTPNVTGPWSWCFGDSPLPEKPSEIYEQWLIRPFGNSFQNTDLTRVPERNRTVTIEDFITRN